MNQRYYMGSGETRTGDFRKQAGLGSALYLAYKMRKKKEEDKYVKSDSASGQMMEHAASYGDIKIPWTPGAKAYFAEEKAKAIAKREANRRAEQLAIQNTDTLKPGRLTLLDRLNRLEETVSDKSKDVYGKVVNLIRDSKKKHTGAAHGLYMHPLGDEPAASYGDIKSKSSFPANVEAYLAEEKAKAAAKTEANSHPNPYKTMSARDMRLSTSEAARALDGMGVNIYGLPHPYRTMPKGLEYFPIVPKLNPEDYKLKLPSQSNSYPPSSSGANQSVAAGSEAARALAGMGINIYGLPHPDDNLNFQKKVDSGANQSVAAGSEAARALAGMGINIYGLPPPDDNLNFQKKVDSGEIPSISRDRRAEQLAQQNTDTLKPGRLTLSDRLNRLGETVSDTSKDVYGKVVDLIRNSKKKHTGASHGIHMHPNPYYSNPSSSSGANQSVAAGSEAGKQNPDSLGAKLDNAIRRIKEQARSIKAQARSFDSNHGTALRVGGGVAAGLLLAHMLRSMTPKKKKRRHEEAY